MILNLHQALCSIKYTNGDIPTYRTFPTIYMEFSILTITTHSVEKSISCLKNDKNYENDFYSNESFGFPK